MEPLTPAARRDLRAKAHHLEPVVMVGQHGLTPQVLHEIDLALLAHELVKVKVLSDDREVRSLMLADAAKALDCAPVQHVGKVLVLWRPNPEKAEREKAKARAAAAVAKQAAAKKAAGPRAPVDPVRERRRSTSSGWGAEDATASGKGRRGAARHGVDAGARSAGPPGRERAGGGEFKTEGRRTGAGASGTAVRHGSHAVPPSGTKSRRRSS